MKVQVDDTKCQAHGDCVLAAPEVFALDDDDDIARVLNEEPDESLHEKVRQAVRVCPVAAIIVTD